MGQVNSVTKKEDGYFYGSYKTLDGNPTFGPSIKIISPGGISPFSIYDKKENTIYVNKDADLNEIRTILYILSKTQKGLLTDTNAQLLKTQDLVNNPVTPPKDFCLNAVPCDKKNICCSTDPITGLLISNSNTSQYVQEYGPKPILGGLFFICYCICCICCLCSCLLLLKTNK